jgi:drug/metabolite transporter (DMT)-like permease
MPPWIQTHLGEVAAFSTAALWVVSSMSFTAAGREVGSSTVNMARSTLAVALLGTILLLRFGTPIPDLDSHQWLLLGLSGIVGLAVGDQLLFSAFVNIGPRVSMLVMTLAPVFALAFAAIFLGERVRIEHVAGIAVTLVGVAVVVTARREHGESRNRRMFGIGLLVALGATVCQAGGMVMAKRGMDGVQDVVSSQAGRMAPATAALAAMLVVGRAAGVRLGSTAKAGHRPNLRRAALCIALGTLAGPVGGVMCALYAITHLPVGVATTLMALTPVLILPVAVTIDGERLTVRAVAGAVVAVVGSAILALG